MTVRTVKGTRYGAGEEPKSRARDGEPWPQKSIRFPPGLLERIEAKARASGRTFSEVAIEALERGLT